MMDRDVPKNRNHTRSRGKSRDPLEAQAFPDEITFSAINPGLGLDNTQDLRRPVYPKGPSQQDKKNLIQKRVMQAKEALSSHRPRVSPPPMEREFIQNPPKEKRLSPNRPILKSEMMTQSLESSFSDNPMERFEKPLRSEVGKTFRDGIAGENSIARSTYPTIPMPQQKLPAVQTANQFQAKEQPESTATQNLENNKASLHLKQASRVSRVMAYFIDSTLVLLVGSLFFLFGLSASGGEHLASWWNRLFELNTWQLIPVFSWGFSMVGLLFLIYHFLSESIVGRTLGKWAMGLRVVSSQQERINPLSSFIRQIGFLLSMIPMGLGLIWSFVDGRGRPWHDVISNTQVLQENEQNR